MSVASTVNRHIQVVCRLGVPIAPTASRRVQVVRGSGALAGNRASLIFLRLDLLSEHSIGMNLASTLLVKIRLDRGRPFVLLLWKSLPAE